MGNKLKNLFTQQDSYEFKIHFTNLDTSNEFWDKLKLLLTDPKTNDFSVQGKNIAEITSFRKTPVGNHFLNNTTNIDHITCLYPIEPFICSISYNKQSYEVVFRRFVKTTGVFFDNDPESIIYFSFCHASNSKYIEFHWKINFEKASSYKQLATEAEAYYYLLIKITNPSTNVASEKLKENILIFYRLIQSFKRIVEVEKKLGKNFSPSKCVHSKNEMSKFEYIYQALVKEVPIRDDISYKNISSTIHKSVPLPMIGTKLLLQHDLAEIISIAEENISLYTMQFYFNAVVSSIEEENKNNNMTVFIGTEEEPLYSVKKTYLSSSNAPKMTGDITNLVLPIMKAKTLSELLSDLEKQEIAEVEKLWAESRKKIKLKIQPKYE